ncbi:extracellular solute-binding protein [Streptomyces hoynatensis]|uniref:Carbohydrate ABC transporter substrate-binding protein n=1 Tax=Streptomyces hoynatensis TaxID=1141874 RepID=A0A3A9YXX8_9ACTN|nr:ABC transporter substrate-binding protein [Streptomyces hoynatensis]RKN40504.1 carbohydrate ABC transporter substrate-binding protein [Streptomyces hoynatensis]
MRNTVRTTRRPLSRTSRAFALGLSATLAAGLLAACSSDDDDGSGGDGDQLTLRVGVFGQFGFQEAGLYDEYMELHPEIKIEQDSTTENGDYITALRTHLSQNAGLDDIQAIEIGNIAEMTHDLPDAWVDFNEYDVDTSHFMPFKVDQATDADGRLIALGTDIGPTGICYRTDYFEQAGLPTDPEAVGELFSSWDSYLAAGEEFKENAPDGVTWMDAAGGMFNAVVSGYEERYTNAAGEEVYENSEAVQTAWDYAVQAAQGDLTDDVQQFTDPWNAAMTNGAFATLAACPAWMLGYIASTAGEDQQGLWNIAASPAPSNWGGSFIGVPEASDHHDEAVALAQWLTAPEQQAKLFTERGSYPSSAEAQQAPEVLNATNPYFGDAPIGQFFSEAAAQIPSSPIGPNDQIIQETFTNQALLSIEQNGTDPDDAWDDALSSLENALAE